MTALHPLPDVYLDGPATDEQREAFFRALAVRYPAGDVLVLPACGAIDAVHGELGPVCTEVAGHVGLVPRVRHRTIHAFDGCHRPIGRVDWAPWSP